MPTLYNQSDKNIRLTWVYITGFLVFVIAVGYVLSTAMGSRAVLLAAIIFSFVMSFASYWWSDKIVLSMSGAKEVKRENAKAIYNVVENLCITNGMPVPKIFVIPDPSLNAFATGRDPNHAVIALTSGLIEKLEKIELEGVIAHELSHIKNRDTLISTVIVILVGFVALLADWFRSWVWFGGDDEENSGQFGWIMFLIGIVLSILAPLAAVLVQLAISRKREFLADADGALITRYPEGLARALEKISADPAPMRHANRATAHLFITNPFKARNISTLFMTHPPIEERIKALREMDI